MIENLKALVLHHGFQIRDNRPWVPILSDFTLPDVDVMFSFDREQAKVEIPLDVFPAGVRTIVNGLQDACRQGEYINPRLGSLGDPGRCFQSIQSIEVHALSPEGDDEQTTQYRLFVAFRVAHEEYRSGQGGDGEYIHYLLGEMVVDAELALKLVQHLMQTRVQRRLKIDVHSVRHRVADIRGAHSLGHGDIQAARERVFVEHGLDDVSIARKREELLGLHCLSDEGVASRLEALCILQEVDERSVAAQRKCVADQLDQRRADAATQPDPVKALIESAAKIREEDTKPQG